MLEVASLDSLNNNLGFDRPPLILRSPQVGKKTIDVFVDDLDGASLPDDVEATEVTVDGTTYEVYLGPSNLRRFMDFLEGKEPLLRSQRASGGSGASSSSPKTLKKHGFETSEVRDWAIAQGKKLKNGEPVNANSKRLAQEIWDEYKESRSK